MNKEIRNKNNGFQFNDTYKSFYSLDLIYSLSHALYDKRNNFKHIGNIEIGIDGAYNFSCEMLFYRSKVDLIKDVNRLKKALKILDFEYTACNAPDFLYLEDNFNFYVKKENIVAVKLDYFNDNVGYKDNITLVLKPTLHGQFIYKILCYSDSLNNSMFSPEIVIKDKVEEIKEVINRRGN